jgi:lipoprotein-releasing system ATP-binding protein
MSELIRAEAVHKDYLIKRKVVRVLCGASLCVSRGESVAIVGLSGAGKSTFLHILGGLDRPDSGSVRIGESDLYGGSEAQRTRIRARMIGFVFQSYHLLPEMGVVENVMMPAMVNAHLFSSYRVMRRRAMELLTTVGLAERADHMPMELSGGEQQRVALVRALMNDPELILADEPTGNLDTSTGGHILEHLFSLAKNEGRTLVMVTHNEKIAEACDRVFRLENGLLNGQTVAG